MDHFLSSFRDSESDFWHFGTNKDQNFWSIHSVDWIVWHNWGPLNIFYFRLINFRWHKSRISTWLKVYCLSWFLSLRIKTFYFVVVICSDDVWSVPDSWWSCKLVKINFLHRTRGKFLFMSNSTLPQRNTFFNSQSFAIFIRFFKKIIRRIVYFRSGIYLISLSMKALYFRKTPNIKNNY